MSRLKSNEIQESIIHDSSVIEPCRVYFYSHRVEHPIGAKRFPTFLILLPELQY